MFRIIYLNIEYIQDILRRNFKKVIIPSYLMLEVINLKNIYFQEIEDFFVDYSSKILISLIGSILGSLGCYFLMKNMKNIEVKVEDLKNILSKKNSKVVEVGGIFARKGGAKKPQKKKRNNKNLHKSPQKPTGFKAQNRGKHGGSRPYISYKAPRPCRPPTGRKNNVVMNVNVPAAGFKKNPVV